MYRVPRASPAAAVSLERRLRTRRERTNGVFTLASQSLFTWWPLGAKEEEEEEEEEEETRLKRTYCALYVGGAVQCSTFLGTRRLLISG